MIQNTLEMALTENYPMILIFTTVLITIRIVYLIVHNEKFVFHKEMTTLAFLLYALLLFYVVTFQDMNYGTNNFIPFKEIFRYEIGSSVFMHNIIGNIVLFIPFGYFVSNIMKSRKAYAVLVVSIITSLVIEYTQLLIGRTFDVDDIILNVLGSLFGFLLYYLIELFERHMPPFFSSDLFKNILIVVLIIILGIIYTNYTLGGFVR